MRQQSLRSSPTSERCSPRHLRPCVLKLPHSILASVSSFALILRRGKPRRAILKVRFSLNYCSGTNGIEVVLSPADVGPEAVELPKCEGIPTPTAFDPIILTDQLDDVAKAALITDVSEKLVNVQPSLQAVTEVLEETPLSAGELPAEDAKGTLFPSLRV